MVNFSELKKSSGKNSLEKLAGELAKLSGQQQDKGSDDRFWYPNVDKAGNGYAVIRFLPPPPDEDVPFVRVFEHGFQGSTGTWYIESSLTTIGKPDPVSEYNTKLWNSGIESDKEIARKQKRKLNFISNIYVVTDEQNPEKEGKVFLFRYGKKIFDKLTEAMTPQFKDEEPLNPFDFWAGANFKLKIRNVDGYRNYDKSEFAAPSPMFKDDDKMESLWRTQHSLQEFINPKNFKSYDELKVKFEKTLGLTGNSARITKAADIDETPWNEPKAAPVTEFKTSVAPKFDEDDDDSLEFFNKLASRN
jgi:hypothetical protein